MLFYWYQSYHWYQWRPFLSPLTPMESICEYWTTLNRKTRYPSCLNSATQPNPVSDQLGLTFWAVAYGMFQTRFFWKSRPIFVLIFKQSCQKPKKVLTMLKVVEIVKSCWATVAHPWRGRGGGMGVLTTSRIRAAVYSMPALNRKVIRKPDPLPLAH